MKSATTISSGDRKKRQTADRFSAIELTMYQDYEMEHMGKHLADARSFLC